MTARDVLPVIKDMSAAGHVTIDGLREESKKRLKTRFPGMLLDESAIQRISFQIQLSLFNLGFIAQPRGDEENMVWALAASDGCLEDWKYGEAAGYAIFDAIRWFPPEGFEKRNGMGGPP